MNKQTVKVIEMFLIMVSHILMDNADIKMLNVCRLCFVSATMVTLNIILVTVMVIDGNSDLQN